jgi:hypothetical protein
MKMVWIQSRAGKEKIGRPVQSWFNFQKKKKKTYHEFPSTPFLTLLWFSAPRHLGAPLACLS